jgi:hypothetical protein
MNIGITINLVEENESLWTSGIKLNALYLLKVLKEIGYNPYILNTGKIQSPYEKKVIWNTEMFPIYDYNSFLEKTDLMIWLGSIFDDKDIIQFKNTGKHKKIIKYVCGSNYMRDLECSMFPTNSNFFTIYNQLLDEIWYVPQQEELDREYYRVLYNLPFEKIRPVPFIWDSIFLDAYLNMYQTPSDDFNPIYMSDKSTKDKQIACFEPNINIQKWHLNSFLIVEDYLNLGGKFKNFNILCGEQLKDNFYYKSIIEHTSLVNSKASLLNYLPRIPAIEALASYADIVIAHQLLNPLNYSYLDALYLQYPLVHNAPMIKDAGYYYPNNKINEGTKQLKQAIENHDQNIEEYNANSSRVLNRYTINNSDLLETYKQLIESIMEIKNHKLGSIYDWSSNIYKN